MRRHKLEAAFARGLVASLAVIAVLPAWVAATPQEAPDKNSLELVVRGCLKGRELTADEISGSDDLTNEVGMIFRLSAKGQVNDEIKRQNGRRIEATGLVKKTALVEPGFKVAGGRVVIGAGPLGTAPTKNPTRNPQRRIVPMDVTIVEMLAETCRS